MLTRQVFESRPVLAYWQFLCLALFVQPSNPGLISGYSDRVKNKRSIFSIQDNKREIWQLNNAMRHLHIDNFDKACDIGAFQVMSR